MPNNQNFLLFLWNQVPWMIPLLALSLAGTISLGLRLTASIDQSASRLGRSRFRKSMLMGSGMGAVISLQFLRDPSFAGYLLAFSYFGALIGSYCTWLYSDLKGTTCGVTIGLLISIAYFILHVLSVRRVLGVDSDGQLVFVTSLALVVSALLGSKNQFRLSIKNRPHWYCLSDTTRDQK